MTDYILYGSQASLFTGKARAYMNWKGISFEERAVNETVMKTIILPNVGWPVIPVIQTPDGRIIQDTADIIAEIETANAETSVMPGSPLQDFASLLMQVYGDQWLILPAMHYRWNYNEEWIFTEFGKSIAPDAPASDHYAIGKKSGERFRAMVPVLGINDATIPGIEASYEAFLSEFSDHLERHNYALGNRPSLADFTLIGPLYAHLYRDPASREIMERIAPRVARWVERTIASPNDQGALISDDRIPDTLLPLFKRHSAEHLPVLEATNALFAKWCETASSGDELPRALGMASFSAGGCTGQTVAQPFSLFRLQAALDGLDQMPDTNRARADAFLDSIDASALKTFTLSRRLIRKNSKLCLA